MTIEQKAKAYDEALKRAKILYNDKNEIGYANAESVLEEVFPLLKESEDEKIRKELIEFVKRRGGFKQEYMAWLEKQNSNVDNANKEYWRGYREGKQEVLDKYAELEKQGDSPIKWNKNTEGNKPQVNHSVLIKSTNGLAEGEWYGGEYWTQYRWSSNIKDSDVLSWMELSDLDKQGEKKLPIEKLPSEMKTIGESLGFTTQEECNDYNKMVTDFIMFDDNDKQKLVWDEEDEHRIKLLEALCEDKLFESVPNSTMYEEMKITIDWLNSLRPQPKQEWSKEDEKMIGRIRSIIEAYAFSQSAVDVNGDLCEKEYIDADNWLKSLKQRIGG